MAWDFPHCLGVVDGKNVLIIPPSGAGSNFYNYNGIHSLILKAVANAKYEFIMVDFGMNGRVSDGGVIENTIFYEHLSKDELPILPDECEVNSDISLPVVIVRDEAFALKKNHETIQLDHDRKIFSYKLCGARSHGKCV